jgi:hypothetical protein
MVSTVHEGIQTVSNKEKNQAGIIFNKKHIRGVWADGWRVNVNISGWHHDGWCGQSIPNDYELQTTSTMQTNMDACSFIHWMLVGSTAKL